MKSTISLSYNNYPQEDVAAADMSFNEKDLIDYSKAISDRKQRISNIRQLYSGNDFNSPIYEMAFKALLQDKKNYKKDFVVPFENPLEQDLVLTPNGKVRLISFSAINNVYNTKYLKNDGIFLNYGPSTRKVVSLYISKDGHLGFLIRYNRYAYERDYGNSENELPINDGEFKGEAYESTLVNLIMFFSSIIKNNEINIINTIEEISQKNPSSTISHVYLKTKENIENIDKIDGEFADALLNSDVGKNSKIDYIDSIKNYFNENVLPIKFLDPGAALQNYSSKYPLFTYEFRPVETPNEFNFALVYENTNRVAYSSLALLIPTVIRIRDNKLYLLYPVDNNSNTIPSAGMAYSFDNCKINEDTVIVNKRSYTLVERENYLSMLRKLIRNSATIAELSPEKNVSIYSLKFDDFHKMISLNFISRLKTSKRRLSLIENKLTPYEYKLKIINVLSDILVKAFTSEILVKKI